MDKKCAYCDEPILKAASDYYHDQCFRCAKCSISVSNCEFVAPGRLKYCKKCFVDFMALKCLKCSNAVISPGIKLNDGVVHRDCFVCEECKKTLGEKFFEKHGAQYCTDCSIKKFVKKCGECTKPIVGESKLIAAEERFYHTSCFRCSACKTDLSKAHYYAEESNFYCQECVKKLEN